MSNDERAAPCPLTEGTCIIDDEGFYVRCVIKYHVIGTIDFMSWACRGPLSWTKFD